MKLNQHFTKEAPQQELSPTSMKCPPTPKKVGCHMKDLFFFSSPLSVADRSVLWCVFKAGLIQVNEKIKSSALANISLSVIPGPVSLDLSRRLSLLSGPASLMEY